VPLLHISLSSVYMGSRNDIGLAVAVAFAGSIAALSALTNLDAS
jgi:hypothetical protein